MTKIKEIINCLEMLAPPSYQEDYDNAGLLVGSPEDEVSGILFSLDTTEAVVEEAIARNCNLIVAHHPIVFKGIKKLTGKNYVERTVINAIRGKVAIYAAHTNLDHVADGVNKTIAKQLGLNHIRVLAPKKNLLSKLTFFSPTDATQTILDALYAAGAGQIGNYSGCSFRTEGMGSFTPGSDADPYIGKSGDPEEVTEHRAEVMFPGYMESKIIDTVKKAHPYEEVAYYLTRLENENQEVGAGAIGELENALTADEFLSYLKTNMDLKVIRHTTPVNAKIKRVAVCGGAGSFLLNQAIGANADVFITADYKYHEFFDADNRIMICDIGHYESEVYTKNLLYNYLSDKFPNFALCLSEVNTNPVRYFV